ncbi:hypothetical protein IU462_31535, partial [Nocardia farcinica]|uniref:hypothetical protein n=1 Tax=Nocardia farcinica TaxID=37329 RepID=UPI001895A94C
DVKTTISTDDVGIYLTMPVKTENDGIDSKMSEFFIIQDVEFKSLYDFSSTIVELEKSNNYFETALLEWLSIFSGIDEDMLPPMGLSEIRETPS